MSADSEQTKPEHTVRPRLEPSLSNSSLLSRESESNPEIYAVLRVECLDAESLKVALSESEVSSNKLILHESSFLYCRDTLR